MSISFSDHQTDSTYSFDIVLYGATGFVGKLTAEYLARAGGNALALAGDEDVDAVSRLDPVRLGARHHRRIAQLDARALFAKVGYHGVEHLALAACEEGGFG